LLALFKRNRSSQSSFSARTLILFALMLIQNNLAENINSFLRAFLCLTEPKTIESVEKRIRATLKLRNHIELLYEIEIERTVRGEFLINNLKLIEYVDLLQRGVIV